jgi:hypothetical protein
VPCGTQINARRDLGVVFIVLRRDYGFFSFFFIRVQVEDFFRRPVVLGDAVAQDHVAFHLLERRDQPLELSFFQLFNQRW